MEILPEIEKKEAVISQSTELSNYISDIRESKGSKNIPLCEY